MASKEQVEVELKVLLDSESDYNRVKSLLGNVPVRVENQENHFFEGLRGQLFVFRHSTIVDALLTY